MADLNLNKSTPFDGCDLPQALGAARLSAVAVDAITAIMPLKGQSLAVAKAMKTVLESTLPKVGEMTQAKGAEMIWFAQGQWLVFCDNDPALAAALQGIAVVSDQSDGWAVMELSGVDAVSVLARLCPLDFDDLPVGKVARSELALVPAIFIPRKDGFRIAVPRSFAQSVIGQVVVAMKSVAAQALL